ncbi:MAG: DNA-protecting protein DprA [Deltaproteobacteria bacterium]|nr:DNA-protecting protein DprA [Deltaproteobacteria bacterium]
MAVSPNTSATLLLTAPLLVGRRSPAAPTLKPAEYRQLAIRLRGISASPADLLGAGSGALLLELAALVEPDRMEALLARGFQLAQALEAWETRGIWVLGRGDAGYPKLLKARLRDDAPPLLYGAGSLSLLEPPALAVVGSRNLDEAGLRFAYDAGALAVAAGAVVVSGGARGADAAAMTGAMESGGGAVGLLADSLARAVLEPVLRDALAVSRALLLSPYDPGAGFLVGHAMARNKLIYGLAQAGLVVSTDFEKGGTWSGAVEQLDRYRFVPLYVRRDGRSRGAEALLARGAKVWPEGQSADELGALLRRTEKERPTVEPVATESVDAVSEAPRQTSGAPSLFDAVGAEQANEAVAEEAAAETASPPSTGEVELAMEPVVVQEGAQKEALPPVSAKSPNTALRDLVLELLADGPLEIEALVLRTGCKKTPLQTLLRAMKSDEGLVTVSKERWSLRRELPLL